MWHLSPGYMNMEWIIPWEARCKFGFGKYFLKACAVRTHHETGLNYILPLEIFKGMCVPMADSCFDVWRKPTQYCKAIILQLKIKNKTKLWSESEGKVPACLVSLKNPSHVTIFWNNSPRGSCPAVGGWECEPNSDTVWDALYIF